MPGSARLVLASGVVHLDEQAAVFEAMLSGWERQQRSRLLAEATIEPRVALLRRFTEFAESFPWQWNAGDVEDFTVSLMSGGATAGAVDDPRLPPDVADVLRLPDSTAATGGSSQCEQRFGDDPLAGLPRLQHRRASERL